MIGLNVDRGTIVLPLLELAGPHGPNHSPGGGRPTLHHPTRVRWRQNVANREITM
jgi:hypothetical protein